MRWTQLGVAVILFCTSHECLGQTGADSGRIVVVNDRRVHVVVAGQGQPTVVFEAGFVNDLRSWAKVQAEIAKSCTTVSYDRAGLGLSEESSSPRSGEQIATDLHALLRKLGVTPPYILAGHSAGGLYIRSFAHRYPNEIGGMIFVDAVLPEYLRWLQRTRPRTLARTGEDWDGFRKRCACTMARTRTDTEGDRKEWTTPPRTGRCFGKQSIRSPLQTAYRDA